MKTESRRVCPSCGNEFSGAMEFCPVCMLREALAGDVQSDESLSEDTPKSTSQNPVQRFEHYELVTGVDGTPVELGRGAMGVTYKAFDVDLRCPVALKVISERYLGDESARLRFLREARAAARLRHSNVASVLHLGRTGSSYFYAMEFVEGETLEDLIKRSGRVEVKLALEIATQVAAGLAAVHKQKLVHRDIKPSNIMVSLEDGDAVTAKIIDLGLAKAVNEPGSQTAISIPGGFAGTPEFASPEQFAGVGVDIRSDLYALGVMLWRTVTGHAMFRGSPAEVMYQHQHAPLPLDLLEAIPQPVVVLLEVLLEKDPGRRFQNPAELLKAMPAITGAIDARRRITRQSLQKNPLGPPLPDSFIDMEPRTLELRPEPGSLLKDRYRLIEDVNPANPGRIFHAEDILARMRVTVRIFLADPAILAQIDEEADRIKGSAHRNFIQLFAIEREKNICFIVLEWLEGFPLVDLLRARRALTLREMLMLLQQIAPAVDAAREAHLSLEMKLRDIFLHFPESFAEPVANIMLRCPLDEWPAFVVKMSLLEKIKGLEGSAGPVEEQTIIFDLKPQRDVVQLGIVAYELLGGKPGRFAPLAKLSEKGNEVLRKCLTPDRSFSTAAEFYESLRLAANPKSEPVASVARQQEPGRLTPPRHEVATGTSAGAVPAQSVPPSNPIPAPKNHFWPIAGALTAILLAIGAVWIFLPVILNPTPNQEPQVVTETHSQKTNAAFGSHPPPQPGKPWTNSLDMRFVALGDIYISAWQTRKRDFEVFVQATGYDAVGGMSSAVTQNGFKLNEMSWKAPGFQQTPDHPVVGVSWEDANQFCAWLTKKERSEGTLETFQSYRLPTDREWSRAVGLEHEQGNTPEERSGKIKAVYPWGDAFPPPNDSGNYAGSESRVDTPETWSVIPGFHDAFPRTAPVSAFKANARGLCCIGGNVWEWCMDKLEDTINWRTLRGGSWATSRAEEMLSSYRRGYGPSFRCDDVGFRCVIAKDGAHE